MFETVLRSFLPTLSICLLCSVHMELEICFITDVVSNGQAS